MHTMFKHFGNVWISQKKSFNVEPLMHLLHPFLDMKVSPTEPLWTVQIHENHWVARCDYSTWERHLKDKPWTVMIAEHRVWRPALPSCNKTPLPKSPQHLNLFVGQRQFPISAYVSTGGCSHPWCIELKMPPPLLHHKRESA